MSIPKIAASVLLLSLLPGAASAQSTSTSYQCERMRNEMQRIEQAPQEGR